jgi:hypothetical protein
MIKRWERSWGWNGGYQPNKFRPSYPHLDLTHVLTNSVRAAAPEGIKVCLSDTGQEESILGTPRVGRHFAQLVKDTSIAFKGSNHVVASTSLQVLVFVFSCSFPLSRGQSILIIIHFLSACVRQLGYMKLHFFARRIAPWTPCAPTWNEADGQGSKICAEKALYPFQSPSAYRAVSLPQKKSSVFL